MEDERLDQTLRQQDGDALAREGARDAKTVAQDGNGNHLVLRHFREELVIRGLLVSSTRRVPWSVIGVTRVITGRVCRVRRPPRALGLEPHPTRSSTRIDANAHASTAKHIPVRRALGCWPSPSSYPWTISVVDKTRVKVSLCARPRRSRAPMDTRQTTSSSPPRTTPRRPRARNPRKKYTSNTPPHHRPHRPAPRARESPNASTSAIAIGFASRTRHHRHPRPSSRTLDFFLPPAIALAALAAFDSGAFGGILDRLRCRACTRERARATRGAIHASMLRSDIRIGATRMWNTHRPIATPGGGVFDVYFLLGRVCAYSSMRSRYVLVLCVHVYVYYAW